MRLTKLILLAGVTLLVAQNVTLGQNLIADYCRNVPRQYDPRDPWEVGLVMRTQLGWGGHFYNCDCEEHKRLSPYIHWEQQPTVCCPQHCCWDIKQQINEVRQRVRTGSCRQCKFQLCDCCRMSDPPVRSNCPDDGGGCPSCGAPEYPAPQMAPNPVPGNANSSSDGWLYRLYSDR